MEIPLYSDLAPDEKEFLLLFRGLTSEEKEEIKEKIEQESKK